MMTHDSTQTGQKNKNGNEDKEKHAWVTPKWS